jgi:hypothetical protein
MRALGSSQLKVVCGVCGVGVGVGVPLMLSLSMISATTMFAILTIWFILMIFEINWRGLLYKSVMNGVAW